MGEADRSLVVRVACIAARAEASHRSEMVTQWICGEPLEPLEIAEEWVRCRGPDGYEAWCSAGALVPSSTTGAWAREATLRSLGCSVRAAAPSAPAGFRLWLPFGGRAAPAPGGCLRLPDGTVARPEEPGSIVDVRERSARFPATPAAIVESARQWMGVPYLWGGRTEKGTDCSGMVQAIFELHGMTLPRDSGPQSQTGARVERTGELDFHPGDLLFFGDEGRISHVALAIGGSRILHAADANGAVAADDLSAETPLSRRLRERLRIVRRSLPGSSGRSVRSSGGEPSPPRSRSPRRRHRRG